MPRPRRRAPGGTDRLAAAGVQGPAGLEYAGHVGTGFSNATLDELGRLLEPLRRATSPFATELPRADAKDAVWVTPTLVGEVLYGEWTWPVGCVTPAGEDSATTSPPRTSSARTASPLRAAR